MNNILEKAEKISEELKEMSYLEAIAVLKIAQELVTLNAVVKTNKVVNEKHGRSTS